MIGAKELADKAAHLEQCGDNKDEKEIKEHTPSLLALYRSYEEKLASVVIRPPEELPKLEESKYKEALGAIYEFAKSYDFNAIDSIMEMLNAYSVPNGEEQRYEEIKKCVRAGDSVSLQKILQEQV